MVGRVDERMAISHQRRETVQVTVVDVLVELDDACSRIRFPC